MEEATLACRTYIILYRWFYCEEEGSGQAQEAGSGQRGKGGSPLHQAEYASFQPAMHVPFHRSI